MGSLHFNSIIRSRFGSLSTAGQQAGAKRFLTVHRRSGFELAGWFIVISILAVTGTALRGNHTGSTAAAHASNSPAPDSAAPVLTASGDTSSISPASSAPGQTAQSNTSDGTTTNISVNATTSSNSDGSTSGNTQVSVNGQPVDPAQNGSTTHVFTTPDGQQTTVSSTTSANQTGDGGAMGNNFTSNNLYFNSSSFSNKFQEDN